MICTVLIIVTAGAFIIGLATENKEDEKEYKILLDPGHGEPDGGAAAADGTTEASLNLDLTKKLDEMLSEAGYETLLTREDESGIHDSSLETVREMKRSDMYKRLDMKNSSGADIFVSIHMNKFEQSKYRGPQVLYDKTNENAKLLAEQIQIQLNLTDPENNTRQAAEAQKSVFLLQSSKIPSVIVECGFLSNPEELELLKTDEHRKKLAEAIKKGIDSYFEAK